METNFGTKLTHLGTELKTGNVGRPKIAPIVMSAAYYFDEPNDLEASSHGICLGNRPSFR